MNENPIIEKMVNKLSDLENLTWESFSHLKDNDVPTPPQLASTLQSYLISNRLFVDTVIEDLEQNVDQNGVDFYCETFDLKAPEEGLFSHYTIQIDPQKHRKDGLVEIETKFTIVAKIKAKIEPAEKVLKKNEDGPFEEFKKVLERLEKNK